MSEFDRDPLKGHDQRAQQSDQQPDSDACGAAAVGTAPEQVDQPTTLDQRDVRALTEYLTVLGDDPQVADDPGRYVVVSGSGRTYTVDAGEGWCSCPDHDRHGHRCKHLRRVAFATGRRAIPAWVNTEGITEPFARHVDGDPVRVATDGGAVEAGDGPIDTQTDERPDECACGAWNAGEDLPCWPCYRDGFETPAGHEGGA